MLILRLTDQEEDIELYLVRLLSNLSCISDGPLDLPLLTLSLQDMLDFSSLYCDERGN